MKYLLGTWEVIMESVKDVLLHVLVKGSYTRAINTWCTGLSRRLPSGESFSW